jgi:hypothetical protein
MSDQTPPVMEAIRRQAGGRLDTPPPIEVPGDLGAGPRGPERAKKRTIEIEDDLADALRVVNSNLEKIIESGGTDIPDAAIPELQKMGELQIRIVEMGGGVEQSGAPQMPGAPPSPGAAPGGVNELPLL